MHLSTTGESAAGCAATRLNASSLCDRIDGTLLSVEVAVELLIRIQIPFYRLVRLGLTAIRNAHGPSIFGASHASLQKIPMGVFRDACAASFLLLFMSIRAKITWIFSNTDCCSTKRFSTLTCAGSDLLPVAVNPEHGIPMLFSIPLTGFCARS